MTSTLPPNQTDEGLSQLEQDWLQIIGELGDDEVEELLKRAESVEAESDAKGPTTPEELDQWFKDVIGVDIPKVSVCPGHTAPFDIIVEIVFFKVLRMLLIASRGGGKTSLMAWVHDFQAKHWPGYQGLTVGASLQQGERMYEHLLPLVTEEGVIGGTEKKHIQRSVEKETIYKNTSKVAIAPATIAAVNGPRVPRLHRDEIEIMFREKPDVYKQSANIPAGRKTKDGRYMPAQVIDTSTMKWAHGIVAQQKTEYEEALSAGRRPPREVRIFCIYEIAKEMPSCQKAPADAREARLRELGRDPCEMCDCHEIVKGTWDDEDRTERNLADVCAGRFFRSRGFKPRDDIITLFYENERREWEAEQECSKPSGEGLYIESFSRQRHGLKAWAPNPDYGPIFQGVDWGGVDQHSVGWYQELEYPVDVELYMGERKTLEPGAMIRFAEIFRGGIGNVALGVMAIAMEKPWRERWSHWRVQERYPDPANASGRLDWRDHLGLTTTSHIKKDFLEEVKLVRTVVDDREFFVVIDQCPWFVKSIEAWHQEKDREVHDWSSHAMAEFRYVVHNRNVLKRKGQAGRRNTSPAAAGRGGGMDDIEHYARTGIERETQDGAEIVGVGGAEDSPVRRGSRSIEHPHGGSDYMGSVLG